MAKYPLVPLGKGQGKRNWVPSASPVQVHTLLLLLHPPDIPHAWAGDQRNQPIAVCPLNPVGPMSRMSQRGRESLLLFLSQQLERTGYTAVGCFSVWSKFALPKSCTCPFITDTLLPNTTTAQEALLFSLVIPQCCEGAGASPRLSSCSHMPDDCSEGRAPSEASHLLPKELLGLRSEVCT